MDKNEAIRIVRMCCPKISKSECDFETAMRVLVPELKVSDDERTRKEIIEYLEERQIIEKLSGTKVKKNWIIWLEKQGEKQDYNPYKATIESIAAMVEKYANGDLKDFYDNIKVKCKDAMEYDKTWIGKQDDNNRLIEEIKKRKELLSKEKEKATSTNDKLSLGGRIAILEELLAFTKEKQDEQKPVELDEDYDGKISELKTFIAKCNGFNRKNREIAFSMIDSLNPQSKWKPTQAQMNALKIVKKGFPADDLDAIESLYNDLKKL